MSLKIKKKGQEEMVGLVLIMLVVAIIFLVFLGIYLRGYSERNAAESKDLSHFLESVYEYTTECGNSDTELFQVKDLITRCHRDKNALCHTGEKACDVLQNTTEKIILSNWKFSEDSYTKGYEFRISRETESGEELIALSSNPRGSQGSARSAEKPLGSNGIIMRLEIYY